MSQELHCQYYNIYYLHFPESVISGEGVFSFVLIAVTVPESPDVRSYFQSQRIHPSNGLSAYLLFSSLHLLTMVKSSTFQLIFPQLYWDTTLTCYWHIILCKFEVYNVMIWYNGSIKLALGNVLELKIPAVNFQTSIFSAGFLFPFFFFLLILPEHISSSCSQLLAHGHYRKTNHCSSFTRWKITCYLCPHS